jgi:addiction module RelE/StbE family toxin
MEVAFKPSFLRSFKKLPIALQQEAKEKIELFKKSRNHEQLQAHKLHGELSKYYSFSVNYRYRIVFTWEKKRESAIMVAIGDHSLYD